MMKTIIFIQINDGSLIFKCDSFWTVSSSLKYAKVYGKSPTPQNEQENIDRWIVSFDYNIKTILENDPNRLQDMIDKYDECRMGYCDVDETLLSSKGFSMDEKVNIDQLTLKYTHEIRFENNLPIISDIRIRYIREEKINNLLK